MDKQKILIWKEMDGMSFQKFLKDTSDDWKVKGIACVIPIKYYKSVVETSEGFPDGMRIAEALVVVNMHDIRSGNGDC